MTSRPFRVSLILITLLFASSCAGSGDSDDLAAIDELPLDDTELIATFDVGFDVPLDIPEELQDPNGDDAAASALDSTEDAMADDESANGADRGERERDEEPPGGLAMSDSDTNDADAPHLRDDGLLFVRSPVMENGQWNSIALLDPDGDIVWSYSDCTDAGCPHDDILVLPNGNVAITATTTVDGRLADNVFELEPVMGAGCASAEWCTGVARRSAAAVPVADGSAGAITLLSAADDYNSWDVLWTADGSTSTIAAQ